MSRLSLYRPEKSKDYKFIDRVIYEQFQVGGVDVFVHKYIGPLDPTDSSKALGETTIQDVVFLENRDRRYDPDVYTIRGHYQTQDIDFNLSQFGLFLQNDTVFLTIHINSSVDALGRKIMSGDVLELPNLADEYAANSYAAALKKFYVVEDVNRAAEGFSPTWYPHLYRIKLKPMVDSQEYEDILNRPLDLDTYSGIYTPETTYYPGQVVRYNGKLYVVKDSVGVDGISGISPPDDSVWSEYFDSTVKDLMSTYEKDLQISNSVNAEAESDSPLSGFETRHFYTLAVDPITGKPLMSTVTDVTEHVNSSRNISEVSAPPIRSGYSGYLLDDGIPPNGPLNLNKTSQFGFGIQFPLNAKKGDTFLRTDFLPNRLFRYDGIRWIKQEDNVRMTLSNTDTRQTYKSSFINNPEMSGINRLATDVITITNSGILQFEPGSCTTEFRKINNALYIVTNIEYNEKYKVELWLDENSKATQITTSNKNGMLAFTVEDKIAHGRLRYSVFDHVINQRQSISKVLKFKPTADN